MERVRFFWGPECRVKLDGLYSSSVRVKMIVI